MRTRALHIIFYLGTALLLLATLFKIMHWSGGLWGMLAALFIELVCNVLILVEIFTSKKAGTGTKLFWGLCYLFIPVISCFLVSGIFFALLVLAGGSIYLNRGRKKFLYVKNDHDHIRFDSIDIDPK